MSIDPQVFVVFLLVIIGLINLTRPMVAGAAVVCAFGALLGVMQIFPQWIVPVAILVTMIVNCLDYLARSR
ncbi:MAG TPA: hypothetical protein EYN91_13585 [Candidatus Melainabacteria bacterium]|jgi:uncharacterized membrane protein|nr:hypothetical protein [Candidatus Melainabacteria bacterium]